MATTEQPVPTPRPSRAALLRQITDLLTQTEPCSPTAVGISLDGDEIELAMKPIDGADVVHALSGFHAPAAWDAFAVVAPARAHRVDGGPIRSVYLGVLAARDGMTASTLVGPDDTARDEDATADNPTDDTAHGEGRVLDACRRVLGLATPPPAHGPEWWAAAHWVDAVLAAVVAADLGAVPEWADLALLDPGVATGRHTWTSLRARSASGALRIPGVPPTTAAWMDDGMFSREAIAAYPPLPGIVADLRELLPWSSYESMLRVLCAGLENAGAPGRGSTTRLR